MRNITKILSLWKKETCWVQIAELCCSGIPCLVLPENLLQCFFFFFLKNTECGTSFQPCKSESMRLGPEAQFAFSKSFLDFWDVSPGLDTIAQMLLKPQHPGPLKITKNTKQDFWIEPLWEVTCDTVTVDFSAGLSWAGENYYLWFLGTILERPKVISPKFTKCVII